MGTTSKSFHRETFSRLSDEEILKYAHTELDETPEKVKDGIELMKKYIKQHQLPCFPDEFLLKFLRVKKFRFSDSCQLLQNFIKSLKLGHEKLGPIDVSNMIRVFKTNMNIVLPYRDPDGRIIAYYRSGVFIKEKLNVKDSMNNLRFLVYATIEDPATQTHGVNYIIDCRGITIREIYEHIDIWIMLCKSLGKLPLRIHRIDVIYEIAPFRIALNILRPILSAKILKRIHCHGDNMDSLLQYYDRSAMTEEFGGTAGPANNDHWLEKMNEIGERFIDLQEKALRMN